MRILIYTLILFLGACSSDSKIDVENDIREIKKVLSTQQKAWTDGDIKAFMDGYWHSEDLKFYGKSGLTKGWQQTLDNYKLSYPTKAETGNLKFTINDISPIEKNSYFVMGEFYLEREVGDANGIFMIIFKKINGQWKIISDTSC